MSSTENGNSGGEERERFSGRIAFYLAAIGSAVGWDKIDCQCNHATGCTGHVICTYHSPLTVLTFRPFMTSLAIWAAYCNAMHCMRQLWQRLALSTACCRFWRRCFPNPLHSVPVSDWHPHSVPWARSRPVLPGWRCRIIRGHPCPTPGCWAWVGYVFVCTGWVLHNAYCMGNTCILWFLCFVESLEGWCWWRHGSWIFHGRNNWYEHNIWIEYLPASHASHLGKFWIRGPSLVYDLPLSCLGHEVSIRIILINLHCG